MRVLVCGSRTFRDGVVNVILDGFNDGELTVIEGGAAGADRLASLYAFLHAGSLTTKGGVGHEKFPADWVRHGKAAGPIRNQQMLTEGKPDAVLAFVDKPLTESRGTNDMVTRARKAGLPVYVIEAQLPTPDDGDSA